MEEGSVTCGAAILRYCIVALSPGYEPPWPHSARQEGCATGESRLICEVALNLRQENSPPRNVKKKKEELRRVV